MLTIFKKVAVINKKIKTPDYNFINGDYFSDENNWIELFNKEKDICILIEDNIEYLKFVIRYYKTILENITEKELYVLYHLSLCKENVEPISYNDFITYMIEEKYILSEKVKYKIYSELPSEFFISSIMSGIKNEIVEEKIKSIFLEYLNELYYRSLRLKRENITLFEKCSSTDFGNLFCKLNKNDIKKQDIKVIVKEIQKSVLKDDITYKLVKIVKESLENNDLIKPFKADIDYLKINPYSDVLIDELNNFDFYNRFVIYYIYELFYENDIETLKRISLTWI